MTWNPGHFADWNQWTPILMMYGYGTFLALLRNRLVFGGPWR
jgi:hypothetical protein